jgi:hypothetical protein
MASTRPNGKGDRPRKVNGPKYRSNYDSINWNPTIRGVPLEEFKKDILKCWTPDPEFYEMENPEKDPS